MGKYYLFVTSISFAVSDSLWKIPLREISSAKGIFIRNIATTTFLGLLALLAQEENKFTAEDVVFCVFISFVSYWGLYFFVQSQKFLSLTITHRILKISAIFHFLWSIFYYREAVDCQKTILFLISLVASLLIIFNSKKKDKLLQRKGVFFAILASIFWGVSYAFFKDASTRLGEARFAFILELTILCTSALLLVFNFNFHNKVSFKYGGFFFLFIDNWQYQ